MKVIDLLNKIANGEEVPKKIKFEYLEYELLPERNNYYCSEHMRWFTNEINALGVLNDEVEIIEEDKETKSITKESIEALGYACGEIQKCFTNGWSKSLENKPLKEDKEIEEIKQIECYHQYDECWVKDKFYQDQKGNLVDEIIIDKINEIIDRINEMRDK